MILAITGLLPLCIGFLLWWPLRRRCPAIAPATTAAVLLWFWLNGCGLFNPLYARVLSAEHWPSTARFSTARPVIVLLGGGTEFTGPRRIRVSDAGARHDESPETHPEERPAARPAVRPKGSSIEKIALVARLYHQARDEGRQPTVIISGGDPQHHGIAEADDYKPDLVALGVPADAVIAENRSLNTYQNAAFVRPLVAAGHYDEIVLVTTATHMRRSLLDFARFNMTAAPVAAPLDRGDATWLPTIANLARATENLHEIVGIAQFFVYRALRRY